LTLVNDEKLYWDIRSLVDKDPTLEDMQLAVGGYVESVIIFKDLKSRGIDSLVNENGKALGLKPTLYFSDAYNNILDVIVGNICFLATDEEGETHGLSADEVKDIIDTKFEDVELIKTDKNCNIFKEKPKGKTIEIQ